MTQFDEINYINNEVINNGFNFCFFGKGFIQKICDIELR